MMQQTIRISDALLCILLNAPKGPNLACPRESLFKSYYPGNAQLWKGSLALSPNRITQIMWDTINLKALASARIRGGCRVWEIDRLYLPAGQLQSSNSDHGRYGPSETDSLKLLVQLVQSTACRSAERIFLRLPSDIPKIPLPRLTGLFPYFA